MLGLSLRISSSHETNNQIGTRPFKYLFPWLCMDWKISLFVKSPSEEIIRRIWICVDLCIQIEAQNQWIFMINPCLGGLFKFATQIWSTFSKNTYKFLRRLWYYLCLSICWDWGQRVSEIWHKNKVMQLIFIKNLQPFYYWSYDFRFHKERSHCFSVSNKFLYSFLSCTHLNFLMERKKTRSFITQYL